MLRVIIYSRAGCHLCEVTEKMARRLQEERPFALDSVNVDGDTSLLERYGSRVPVVVIDGVEQFAGRATEGELRRAIKRARWREPISRILSRLRQGLRRG